LTVNESKTRVCRLPEEKFDFLGYTFGRCYSPKTGRAYWGTTPSKKRVQRLCKSISEMTRRSQTQQDAATLVGALNRKINGWANYFCLGPVSQAYRAVEQHTCRRLRQWLCVKHKERAGGEHAVSPEGPASEVWLGSPDSADRQLSVGDNGNPSPRAGCVNCACPVR
jgi:RNA-directed DNA polymerase